MLQNKKVRIMLIIIASLLVALVAGIIIYLNITIYANRVPTVEGEQDVLPEQLPTNLLTITEEEYHDNEDDVIDDEDTEPQEEVPIYKTVEISDKVYNFLIIGDDARINQPRSRSDTLIMCSYNRETKEIKLVSFLRDTLIPLGGDKWGRINSPYMSGGPGKAINTINNIFSLDVQRYVIIRFNSVFALVDRIGGIDVEVTAAEAKYVNRIFPEYDQLEAGLAHMNGRQALAFARARKVTGSSGDFERSQRQRDVIMACFSKAKTLRSGNEIAALVNFGFENVETNIPLDEIVTMALEVLSSAGSDFGQMRIPADNSYYFARYQGASVLNINFRKNIELLHEFLYGSAEGVKIPSFHKPEMDAIDSLDDEDDDVTSGTDVPDDGSGGVIDPNAPVDPNTPVDPNAPVDPNVPMIPADPTPAPTPSKDPYLPY